jgi:hypothetical protein
VTVLIKTTTSQFSDPNANSTDMYSLAGRYICIHQLQPNCSYISCLPADCLRVHRCEQRQFTLRAQLFHSFLSDRPPLYTVRYDVGPVMPCMMESRHACMDTSAIRQPSNLITPPRVESRCNRAQPLKLALAAVGRFLKVSTLKGNGPCDFPTWLQLFKKKEELKRSPEMKENSFV